MCRGSDQNGRRRRSKSNDDDEVLRIKAFYVRLLFSTTTHHSSLASLQSHSYDSLTLHFPPRINGAPLGIEGFALRPDAPAFVTLHRVVVTTSAAETVYASRERLRMSEGLRFEIYACDVKVLKGIVRRKDEENWRFDLDLDCKAPHVGGGEELQLQLSLETEGLVAVEISEKRSGRIRYEYSLEEIPEQRESESDIDDCCCCWDGMEDADEWRRGVVHGEVEVEVEGVKWAVDVAIWVVCLGVGYFVSKASRYHRSIRTQSRLF